MSIRTTCRSCGKRVKAPDSAAGKRGKCPFCGDYVNIPSFAQLPEVTPVEAPAVGPPSDSAKNKQPVMSVKANCLSWKKQPWNLDIYDTYAIFTDSQNSKQFRFPNETNRYGFANPFISGYNFAFVPYSRQCRFLLDKHALSRLRALHSNWSALQKAKPVDQGQSAVDSEVRNRLVGHVRFWSGFQLVAVVISLPLLIASSGHAHLAPLWIPALLLIGFLAVNAWRLKRWAILCEAVLYTGSSLLNLTVLLFNIGRGGEVGFYLLVSTVNAVEFFRAFKAGVGSSDSESTKSEEI